jgi:cell division septal protein FtsQ
MKRRPNRNMNPSTILLIRQIIVGALIAAFFGLLTSSIWYITRIDALTIDTVTVHGGETIQHSEVESVVRSRIEGTYLKLVPRAFAFTYPREEIISEVNKVHRIKNVRIVRSGGDELLVEFDEYVPHALWCKTSDSSGCFFLDENGYSFSPAPTLVGGSFLRFVSIAKDPSEHVQAFPEEEYKRVHELVQKFAAAKWFVSKAEIDAAGDAFLTIVDGGEFKVSLKQSADETVSNLLTVLGSENFAHIKPGNFEYIDLRFGSKVFVNEVTIDNNASSTASKSPSASSAAVETASTPTEESPAPDTSTADMVAAALASSTEDN